METLVTIPSEAVATADFIIQNLSAEDLRVVMRDIIRSSMATISSHDLSHLTNSIQMVFSQAEFSAILHTGFQASDYSAPDAEVRRMDTYLVQREQALRTIAEFEHVKEQLVSEYGGRYVAFYEGQVVDSDWDEAALSRRFYDQHGNVAVCIAKVSEELETIQILTPLFRYM